MTIEEAKKKLMVCHRDSPIGEDHEYFYTVASVHRTIEDLIRIINKKEDNDEYFEKEKTDNQMRLDEYTADEYNNLEPEE